ncbi:Glutamate--tRNA ligase mitochondrial, partial [Tulasnella sp. 408]
TRERLARMRSNATYDRTCLHLTDEEVARRVKAGEKHVVSSRILRFPGRLLLRTWFSVPCRTATARFLPIPFY